MTNQIAKLAKCHQETRLEVRTQTLDFFIDRLERGLVVPLLASPQPVQ
jgi:hypothetical protein